MPEGDVTPVTDPIVTQVSTEYVNENGNTVVIGYTPSVTIIYEGTPSLGEAGGGLDQPPTDEPS